MEAIDNSLAVLVKREEKYFVSTGKSTLKVKDKILIITDNHEALMETYEKLGIDDDK